MLLRRRFSFFAAEETRVAEEEIQFLCCRGDSCRRRFGLLRGKILVAEEEIQVVEGAKE